VPGEQKTKKYTASVFLWCQFSQDVIGSENNLEAWRSYAVYENGYEARKLVEIGTFGKGSVFEQCMEQADYLSWKRCFLLR
jgi:hypothetical protein